MLLAFAAAVVFGGANAVAVRLTVAELAPFWSATLRFVVAAAILAIIALALRRPFPRGGSLIGGVLFGVVGFAAAYGFLYQGLNDAPAATAGVILGLMPILTFGLAILHRLERFRLLGLIGGLIALAGVAISFADQLSLDVPLLSLVMLLLGVVSAAESGSSLRPRPGAIPSGPTRSPWSPDPCCCSPARWALVNRWRCRAKPPPGWRSAT